MTVCEKEVSITDVTGPIPYRLALAGGWIDQPFVSRLNPVPPGSMVTVCLEPEFRWMDRCGICSSTRRIAMEIWPDGIPAGDREELVQQLYQAENEGLDEPSGSQDMVGIIYPGINRIDYDFEYHGGYFPKHVESCNDPRVAAWVENVVQILPIAQRPDGYNPLGVKNLTSEWVGRLGQTGKDCYDAIVNRDVAALGRSMNDCMICWETLLPDVVHHHTLRVDLMAILKYYQSRYPGAMYSGCGGGYLYVASDETVPGAFRAKVLYEK